MNYGRRFVTLGFLWKEWCWSWSSSTLATSCEQLTQWKRLWCWEGLGAGGEGDDRGWDGWMASRTRWTWVWVNSGRWWWTGRPGVLRFMGSQRAGHDWATELNWSRNELSSYEKIWRNLKCILLSERSQPEKATYFNWIEIYDVEKPRRQWKIIGFRGLTGRERGIGRA